MGFSLSNNSFIVFDLDDTIYKEIDFVKSAFKEIAALFPESQKEDRVKSMFDDFKNGADVFSKILKEFPDSLKNKSDLIEIYRLHRPCINFFGNADLFINHLIEKKIPFGIITDGRSVTQRNKIAALGLENLHSGLIISDEFGSEKPDIKNFLYFEEKFPGCDFTYIADNTKKDFVSPEKLGWQMVCIKDNGENIHLQNLELLPPEVIVISDFAELIK
jgi:putative hydrolase of the HAD superfamily